MPPKRSGGSGRSAAGATVKEEQEPSASSSSSFCYPAFPITPPKGPPTKAAPARKRPATTTQRPGTIVKPSAKKSVNFALRSSSDEYDEDSSSSSDEACSEVTEGDLEGEEEEEEDLEELGIGAPKAMPVATTSRAAAGASKKATPKKTRGQKRKDTTDELTETPTASTAKNAASTASSMFLPFSADWSPVQLYRMSNDIVATAIRESRSEGVPRIAIARKIGLDATTKAGNRRVSAQIQTVMRCFPKHFGQFQKMEGKQRTIRYFWKECAQPQKFTLIYKEIADIIGRPCPFQMGMVIKFPNSNLSTLRLSDISLSRLVRILRFVEELRVIVTINKITRHIQKLEEEGGYFFQVDKKSMLKCLLALEKEKLIYTFNMEISDDKVMVVTHRSINSSEDPEVTQAITATIDEYNREGRVFPHGQLRFSTKRMEEDAARVQEEKDLETIVEKTDDDGFITVSQRFDLFRLQASRATSRTNIKTKKKGGGAAGDESEGRDAEEAHDAHSSIHGEEEMETQGSAEMTTTARELHEEESLATSSAMATAFVQPLGIHFSDPVNSAFDYYSKEEAETSRSSRPDQGHSLGYQPKMLRLQLIHEIAYQMTHGTSGELRPTLFEKYPLGEPPEKWKKVEKHQIPVYVDEISPLRFLPNCTYAGSPKGWFMLMDLYYSLPLSILVLVARPTTKISKERLLELLRDEEFRHTPLADLPDDVRLTLLHDKKSLKRVEHICFLLCTLGLMGIGANPSPKRFNYPHTTMFYVCPYGELRDTSTSERGYIQVTPPVNQYPLYKYHFDSLRDLYLYWSHLRAIVHSTPLAFRCEVPENYKNEQARSFALGSFNKDPIIRPLGSEPEDILPIGSRDGVAGFESAIFVHLLRHWDPNPRPTTAVSWFWTRFCNINVENRDFVESRVARLERDWQSSLKQLMPTDVQLLKNKKAYVKSEFGGASLPVYRAVQAVPPESKVQKRKKKRASASSGTASPSKKVNRGKRQLDSVDLKSQSTRVHMRSRFNSHERDMLILVRAVGFFLNPVYRFWLNPAVLRDIMHENVPESRTKTVESLMAAGVREMVRPHRLAYLQRIVRNLTTFPEMRALRIQLAESPLTSNESKMDFFRDAFRTAKRLLFLEEQGVPPTKASNEAFDSFLNTGTFRLSTEPNGAPTKPLRSQTPASLTHIHHCVAANVILATLLQAHSPAASERMLEHISAAVAYQALHTFRTDGLVTRVRNFDTPSGKLPNRQQAALSFYFRTFFSHRFHPEIVEMTLGVLRRGGHSLVQPLFDDHVGVVLAALATFYQNKEFQLAVDESIILNFETDLEANVTKQIRYLEGANLQLERIVVNLVPRESPDLEAVADARTPEERDQELLEMDGVPLPSAVSLLESMDRSFAIPTTGGAPLATIADLCKGRPAGERKQLRAVHQLVEEAEAFGIGLQAVADALPWLSRGEVQRLLEDLVSGGVACEGGVDERRWLGIQYAKSWTVESSLGGRRFCPRPWSEATGEVCASTARWMAESVLCAVVAQPGITKEALKFRFDFALQSVALHELLEMLELAGCVRLIRCDLPDQRLKGPFDESRSTHIVEYIEPCVGCIERFARIFGRIPIPLSLAATFE